MSTESTRLVVLAPPDLQSGYLLAGVDAHAVESLEDVEAELDRLAGQREWGVIAVYRPLLEALPADRRRRLDLSMRPVVVPLPTGLAEIGLESRRARLMERLQRAIGYHITFGEEET
jgi:vacuolar-type H+-ATPase subunit F/Vma7